MKNNRAPRRYLIIGSGVAAIAAAQSIRILDPSGEIGLVSDDPAGYYSRPGLAYYLTGELGESQLFPLTRKDINELNLKWYKARAVRIDPPGHRILLDNRAILPYDRLLLATGSQASPLTTPGANLPGVVKLDNLEDARQILQQTRRARTALVVGGGITALELVEGLRARGLKVHYFLRGSRYWNNVLDETESQIVESRLAHEGVQIHYQTELTEITGSKNRITGARTKTGEELRCELVAYAIGVRPRMELAQEAGLRVDRGILVNEFLQTSDPDIFAAGDVAQVFDPFSGQSSLDTLWSTAREQGRSAGSNMAALTTDYKKNAPLNITRLAGLTTTIIGTVGKGSDPSLPGIARGDSETWRQLPVHTVAQTRYETDRLRLLVGDQRLLGAVVMGSQALSLPLQKMVSLQADISPIRQVLEKTTHLSEILTTFWEKWRYEHAVAQP
jgi:NADPH-dependent 2,4-dienoyl-CoA reductase/sulfur reductase-like enzyme